MGAVPRKTGSDFGAPTIPCRVGRCATVDVPEKVPPPAAHLAGEVAAGAQKPVWPCAPQRQH